MLNSSKVLSIMLLMTSLFFYSDPTSNCKVDFDRILLDVSNIILAKYVQSIPRNLEKPTGVDIAVIAQPPLSNAVQNVALYMAGYLLMKVPVSHCDECSDQLFLPRLPIPFQEMSFLYLCLWKKHTKKEVLWSFQHWQWPHFVEHLKTKFCAIFKGIIHMSFVLNRLC